MRIHFTPKHVACFVTSCIATVFTMLAVTSYGCSASQVAKAQSTLNKVEVATTQAASVADTVAQVPGPTQSPAQAVELILISLLALEKGFGSYILPLFQKKSGDSASNSTSPIPPNPANPSSQVVKVA